MAMPIKRDEAHLHQVHAEDHIGCGTQAAERRDDAAASIDVVATAFATPTPPTSNAVRPTSVRNWRKRSSVFVTCGDGSRRSRTLKSTSGSASFSALRKASSPRHRPSAA